MSNPPFVTIVIPVFNGESYILETLESVKQQTFIDYEVVIIDDCSSDSTYSVCQTYCANLNNYRVFKTDANFGCPGGPRNVGVSYAKGKYVAF
jgi:teichuronic acid biosynthesis glycosyltransferase TuaG